MINIKFGEGLKLLTDALDISINRLSKAVNVDSSLANRWINNKRIPAINTHYVEKIVEYLSKNIQNSYQEQLIKEIIGTYIDFEEKPMAAINISEYILKFLKEAQSYSLACKKNEIRLHGAHVRHAKPKAKHNDDTNLNLIQLSDEDAIIPGLQNIIHHSISLIEAAASIKIPAENNTIYITFLNDTIVTLFTLENERNFVNAFLRAIESGWDIAFLIHLDSNNKRTTKLINLIKPLMTTGRLNVYYIKDYGRMAQNYEYLVIPGVGAVSFFAASKSPDGYFAFKFKSSAAVEVVNRIMNSILSSASEVLIQEYYLNNKNDYSYFFTEIEERMGNRFLYRYCFSVLTLSEALFIRLLNKTGLSEGVAAKEINYYKARRQALANSLQTSEYRDIHMLESIDKLIRERQFWLYTGSGVFQVELKVQDIIDLLMNVIDFLEQHDNYYIGFVTGNELQIGRNYFCYVKERQAAFVGAFEENENTPGYRLLVTEPMGVKAIYDYFKEFWERIAPINKNKSDIIHWLSAHVTLLKKQLPSD